MFEILVSFLQICMIFTSIFTLPILFIIRLYVGLKNKYELKDLLMIILIPFSIGYYLKVEQSKQLKIYNILLTIFLVISIIGIMFTLYQVLIPTF